LTISACGSPGYDATNTTGNSILLSGSVDQVNVYLSDGDCGAALAKIKPLYDSINTNNEIRLATAASYGCTAKVNVFQILSDLSKASDLGGSGLWKFLSREFASVANPDDKIPTAAGLGTDAAFSAVNPGTLFVPAAEVNASTKNPGTLIFEDRLSDANSYLTFLSMSLMGSLLSRAGAPDALTHVKTVSLPWVTAATAAGDSCAFASGLLNFFDGLDSISRSSPASVKSSYHTISNFLTQAVDAACAVGCTFICANVTPCSSCPLTLRDRTSCTGVSTDVNSCAAAGIAVFVNGSWI
jgi:hypothetical protein